MVGWTTLPLISDRCSTASKGRSMPLIEDAARQSGLPSTAILRRIAELENTIAAVLVFIEEREGSR
jgi:hypothetical protein